jgi:2-methylcitrate dehydratase
MVAVPLIFGRLTADDYGDAVAADPRIDTLRGLMEVRENPQFTRDYFDPGKRYIGNSVQVFFTDGSSTDRVSVDFPLGHRKRRVEGIPVLMAKCKAALRAHLPVDQVDRMMALADDPAQLDALPVDTFMNLYRIQGM